MAEPTTSEHKSGGFSLTQKMGPLPTYAWIALGVGGYVVFAYLKGRMSTSTATAVTPAQSATTTGAASSSGSYYGVDSSGNPIGQMTSTFSPQAGLAIESNEEWASQAATSLVDSSAQYGWQPTEIETALNGYLEGLPLSGNGPAIVNTAIAEFGSPPQGVVPTAASSIPNTTVGSGASAPTFNSNEQWASYAGSLTDQEVALNPKPYNNLDIQNAISAYINNQPLTPVQTTIVNHVLQLAGPPPIPVSAPGSLTGNTGGY